MTKALIDTTDPLAKPEPEIHATWSELRDEAVNSAQLTSAYRAPQYRTSHVLFCLREAIELLEQAYKQVEEGERVGL